MAWSWQRKVVLLRLVLHQELTKPQLIPSHLTRIQGLDVGSAIQRDRAQTCCVSCAHCCKEEKDSGVLGQRGRRALGSASLMDREGRRESLGGALGETPQFVTGTWDRSLDLGTGIVFSKELS